MLGLWAKHHESISANLLPMLLGAKALCEHCFPPWFRILPVCVADT
jgi:hypothetical protein